MKRFSGFVLGLVLTGATAVPVLAHHPFAAEYDASKPVTLTGTIAKVDWANPHVHTFLDVRGPNGEVTKWDIEMGSISALGQRGWTRQMLKNGDSVTIEGWQAKDGANRANAKTVKWGNERMLSAASSHTDDNARPEVATTGRR